VSLKNKNKKTSTKNKIDIEGEQYISHSQSVVHWAL